MENQVKICTFTFTFTFTWFFFTLNFLIGVHAATITVKNNCPTTIWPAVLTTNPGQSQPSTTGFQLTSGASRLFDVPAPWVGRVWARTRCSTTAGNFTCLTGDCGSGQVACGGAGGRPPATLAEFTLSSSGSTQASFYSLSLVDGFNIPVSITPVGGDAGTCRSSSCVADVNAVCPVELQLKASGSGGEVIGCKGACSALGQARYCCTGEFNSPDKCKPTAYSKIFKAQCPEAYSYAYDDEGSTFSCGNQPDYVTTFCGVDTKISVCRGPIQLDISKVKIL